MAETTPTTVECPYCRGLIRWADLSFPEQSLPPEAEKAVAAFYGGRPVAFLSSFTREKLRTACERAGPKAVCAWLGIARERRESLQWALTRAVSAESHEALFGRNPVASRPARYTDPPPIPPAVLALDAAERAGRESRRKAEADAMMRLAGGRMPETWQECLRLHRAAKAAVDAGQAVAEF